MVWTTTFEVRLPFGAAFTRVVAKPVVARTFAAILAAGAAAPAAGPEG